MTTETLHRALLEKQAQLQKRIDAIGNDFKNGRSADFAEHTTESENDEVLDGIRSEAKFELQQVNDALHRIESGEYGFCSVCSEEISPERLQALPYVTTCVGCAE